MVPLLLGIGGKADAVARMANKQNILKRQLTMVEYKDILRRFLGDALKIGGGGAVSFEAESSSEHGKMASGTIRDGVVDDFKAGSRTKICVGGRRFLFDTVAKGDKSEG